MYKKVILILLVLSPLFFLFVGYPINSGKPQSYGTGIISSRCFEIGNTKQFLTCFKNHKRVSGINLIKQTIVRNKALQPEIGDLLLFFLAFQLLLALGILLHKDKSSNGQHEK